MVLICFQESKSNNFNLLVIREALGVIRYLATVTNQQSLELFSDFQGIVSIIPLIMPLSKNGDDWLFYYLMDQNLDKQWHICALIVSGLMKSVINLKGNFHNWVSCDWFRKLLRTACVFCLIKEICARWIIPPSASGPPFYQAVFCSFFWIQE